MCPALTASGGDDGGVGRTSWLSPHGSILGGDASQRRG